MTILRRRVLGRMRVLPWAATCVVALVSLLARDGMGAGTDTGTGTGTGTGSSGRPGLTLNTPKAPRAVFSCANTPFNAANTGGNIQDVFSGLGKALTGKGGSTGTSTSTSTSTSGSSRPGLPTGGAPVQSDSCLNEAAPKGVSEDALKVDEASCKGAGTKLQRLKAENARLEAWVSCQARLNAEAQAQMKCFADNYETLNQYISTLMQQYNQYHGSLKQIVSDMEAVNQDRIKQVEAAKATAGNAQKALESAKAMVEGMIREIDSIAPQAVAGQDGKAQQGAPGYAGLIKNLRRQETSYKQMVTARKMFLVGECLKTPRDFTPNDPENTGCAYKVSKISLEEYLGCVYRASLLKTANGIDTNTKRVAEANNKAKEMIDDFKTQLSGLPEDGMFKFGGNDPAAVATQVSESFQKMKWYDPKDFRATIRSRMSAYDVGASLSKIVDDWVVACTSGSNKYVIDSVDTKFNKDMQIVDNPVRMAADGLAQTKVAITEEGAKMIRRADDAYKSLTSALRGKPAPSMGYERCEGFEPEDQLDCLREIKARMKAAVYGQAQAVRDPKIQDLLQRRPELQSKISFMDGITYFTSVEASGDPFAGVLPPSNQPGNRVLAGQGLCQQAGMGYANSWGNKYCVEVPPQCDGLEECSKVYSTLADQLVQKQAALESDTKNFVKALTGGPGAAQMPPYKPGQTTTLPGLSGAMQAGVGVPVPTLGAVLSQMGQGLSYVPPGSNSQSVANSACSGQMGILVCLRTRIMQISTKYKLGIKISDVAGQKIPQSDSDLGEGPKDPKEFLGLIAGSGASVPDITPETFSDAAEKLDEKAKDLAKESDRLKAAQDFDDWKAACDKLVVDAKIKALEEAASRLQPAGCVDSDFCPGAPGQEGNKLLELASSIEGITGQGLDLSPLNSISKGIAGSCEGAARKSTEIPPKPSAQGLVLGGLVSKEGQSSTIPRFSDDQTPDSVKSGCRALKGIFEALNSEKTTLEAQLKGSSTPAGQPDPNTEIRQQIGFIQADLKKVSLIQGDCEAFAQDRERYVAADRAAQAAAKSANAICKSVQTSVQLKKEDVTKTIQTISGTGK